MSVKRPSQNQGAIVLVLATAGLDDLFEVRQVTQSRNFQVVPRIETGRSTEYTQLSDWEKLCAFKAAIEACHNAGYSHDLGNGEIEHVGASFRFADVRTRFHRPRFFINEKPFDREKATATNDLRSVLENGSAADKKKVTDMLRQLREQDVPLEAAAVVDPDDQI